jgi:sn-glycerol 3-phosphate transport system substrate-binding protein
MMMKTLLCAVAAIALAATVAIPMDAAARAGGKAAPGRAAKATPPAGEIEFVHPLQGEQAQQLAALVERFNAGSPVKIAIKDRDWATGTLPDLLLLGEDDELRFLGGKPRYKPLYQVMQQAGEPLKTLKTPPVMTTAPLDSAGRIIGLPIGLSTPIMYYNRDAFAKVGLDPDKPPRTWFELQQVLGKLADAGQACPYTSSRPAWIHVENTSAWHNQPFAATRGGRDGPLQINNLLMVKHLALMISWYKSRYLHLFGRGDEGDAKFASGECAVLTGRSSSLPQLKHDAGFDIGVAQLPFHDDIPGAPQNTLADGPVLWAAADLSAWKYKVIARFVAFLLQPASQVEWQRYAGFLPLNRSGVLAAGSELLKSDLAGVSTAVAQLTNKPATPVSRASRFAYRGAVWPLVDEALEAAWADRKPAKEALDDAVARSRQVK